MPIVLVSPAEPASVKECMDVAFRDGWESSSLTERYGVDFLWRTRGTYWGIQRKAVPDFLASMRDGRVTREVAQMRTKVSMPMLVIEGRMEWSMDGQLLGTRYDITRDQWRALMFSLASQGVTVETTHTPAQTVEFVVAFSRWTEKAKHTSLTARPKLVDAPWGKPGNRDWGVFLLQGFDGIGPEVAGAIYDHFGGLPLEWTVTEKELLAVPGLGKGRVKKLMELLKEGTPQ